MKYVKYSGIGLPGVMEEVYAQNKKLWKQLGKDSQKLLMWPPKLWVWTVAEALAWDKVKDTEWQIPCVCDQKRTDMILNIYIQRLGTCSWWQAWDFTRKLVHVGSHLFILEDAEFEVVTWKLAREIRNIFRTNEKLKVFLLLIYLLNFVNLHHLSAKSNHDRHEAICL